MIFSAQDFSYPHCACGKVHRSSIYKIVIEPGCLPRLPEYLKENAGMIFPRASNQAGNKQQIVAVYDSNTYIAAEKRRPETDSEIILPAENLHADEQSVAFLEQRLSRLSQPPSILAAVGSGTVHDIVRYTAAQRRIPFISCPTAATVDGFCSSVAAMTWKGMKTTLPAVAPCLVLADLEVITAAPLSLALSGVGDLMGKIICLADWQIACLLTGEYFCPSIFDLTQQAVSKARQSCTELKSGNLNAFEDLTAGLLLSGVAMQLCGNSRPASGAEHHISHMLEMGVGLQTFPEALHGEKVGVGTCLCARNYHKLAQLAPENIAKHLKPYSFPEQTELKAVFGALLPGILLENQKDCLKQVAPERIVEQWPRVQQILQKIPDEKELTAFFQAIGAKHTLKQLNLQLQEGQTEESMLQLLYHYAPYVRNRLTVQRLLRLFRTDKE